ncbi:MAG: DUF3298 domain-containing protein [Lachnospiraceae bacterium]|nr:DUF3298 domain-containing protein [Lachnospiraceae bacterium]
MKYQNEIQGLKEDYMRQEMTLEQQEKLKQTIYIAKRENAKDRGKGVIQGFVSVAAVLAMGFMILQGSSNTIAYAMEQIPAVVGRLVSVVNFGKYEYEDERHHADMEIPQLVLNENAVDEEVKEELGHATEEINQEISEKVKGMIAEFEMYLEQEKGYLDVVVSSDIIVSTEEYFVLKLMCYQATADGAQWNDYYTIDLSTGERLQLKDIFEEGTDYITPISENIKEQMRSQMKRSFGVTYWIDDELQELNFETITEESSFYLNKDKQLVIAFNEGEVAPMSMGVVEFVIPDEVIEHIRK